MIKIINESIDNFDIENMIFEINLSIPIFHVHGNEKEFAFSENWKIDDLIIPNNVSKADTKTALKIVDKFIIDNVMPTIKDVANEYNWITKVIIKNSSSSNTMKSPQSLAYYSEIHCDISNVNCSDILRGKLSNFVVRVANHISTKERETIKSYGNVKLYSNQIMNLEEAQFIEYLHNIFNAYEVFIGSLSLYPNRIEDFSDVAYNDIALLKQVAVQGRFDGYGD